MEKINIAEILKDCPKGMELDCTIWNNTAFEEIDEDNIVIFRKSVNSKVYLTQHGEFNSNDGKCVIFPKGKTTWEGFVPPCKFKDGDIIFVHTNALKCNLDNSWVAIFKEYRNNRCACYMCLCLSDLDFYHDKWEDELLCELCEIEENRLATEDEKELLFKAIKENGYKWNAETKTLEKLNIKTCLNCKTFEVMHQNCPYSPIWSYRDLNVAKSHLGDETNCKFWNEIPKTKTLDKLIEPKFKIGNKIKNKNSGICDKVIKILEDCYLVENCWDEQATIGFDIQDNWELVPNKFDITTLIPFESKVLVRDYEYTYWRVSFFGFFDKDECIYDTVRGAYKQCIPYDKNEHLLGKTGDCDEFYKTW